MIENWEDYEAKLYRRLGSDDSILRFVINKAKQNPKRVVFAEAENLKTLKAAQQVSEEGIAIPILLGNRKKITTRIAEHGLHLEGIDIIDPKSEEMEGKRAEFAGLFLAKRGRRGVNAYEAIKLMRDRVHFGCMMVETGEADALISGLTRQYPDTIRPALQIIGLAEGNKKAAGMYLMLTKKGPVFLADTTINFNPTEEEVIDITLQTAQMVEQFNLKPRIAMLSYSNYGSSESKESITMRNVVAKMNKQYPNMVVDGELQAGVAFNKELLKENYPFSAFTEEGPNVLIFPNLAAGNIAYHLLQELGGAEAVGPILLGLRKPVHVLQLGSTVRQIVNMVAIAVVDAQVKCKSENSQA